MAISAKDVQALRQRTGLGMMECKQALSATDGDFDAAIEQLRKKLKGKMDERADRATAEGAIAVAIDDGGAAIVELNSETDFAARNESFVAGAEQIVQYVLANGPTGAVVADDRINGIVDNLRITIKENISYRRGAKLTGEKVGSYVHHNAKVGVIVAAAGEIDAQTLTGICQHIAAHVPTPLAVDEAALPQADRDKAMADAKQEAIDSGKPEEIAGKIATGKYKKWVDDNTLLGQQYVKDMEGKSTVGDQIPKGAKILDFVRYAVGT